MRNTFVMFVAVALSFAGLASADTGLDLAPEPYRASVNDALEKSGENKPELLAALSAVKPEHRTAMAFLIANMPQRDLTTLTSAFLVDNVRLAHDAREKNPWAKSVPEEVFLNDVLPYASLNETRDDWRREFYELLMPEVKDCKTAGEAAMKLNQRAFEILKVGYHATKRKKPHQSPRESMAIGYASCTGLSILLVDACRAVGVPARTVGTPSWTIRTGDANGNHGGNHTWAEIWDGQWHFLGACENSRLNQTWFVGNASKADPGRPENRIYASSFARTDLWYPLIWDRSIRYVSADDVTGFYAARAVTKMTLTDADDKPARGHLTVRLAGKIVADMEMDGSVTLNLAGGKKYHATISSGGKQSTREFEVAGGKESVIELKHPR